MEYFYLVIAVAAAIIMVVFIIKIMLIKKPVDRFEEYKTVSEGEVTNGGGEAKELLRKKKKEKRRPKDRKKPKDRSKKRKEGDLSVSNGCEHHFENKGFPADFIGTHYSLECVKCGFETIVTIEESKELLKQRDDVRRSIRRARGEEGSR